jgi:hypothetical protein
MSKARIALVGAAILIAATVTWLWSQREPFASELAEAITQAPDGSVVFSQLTDFQWHSVALFGPYTDQTTVRAALGFNWPDFQRYGLESADSFSLAVFVASGTVVRAVNITRCSPDFGTELLGKSIPLKHALFRVDSSNVCPTLKPQAENVAAASNHELSHVF